MAAEPSPSSKTHDAAILMLIFGEAAAAEVLRHLKPAEVQHLVAAMYSVTEADQEDIDAIVERFLEHLTRETGIGHGAPGYVRAVTTEALGEDRAQSVLSRINPSSTERPIEILDWMDPRSVADLIEDEHPQIISLVVACLENRKAAEVLTCLPEAVQPDVIRRVAQLGTVPPEALSELEQVLQRKFNASTSTRASQLGGVRAAARIMNFTRGDDEARILRDIRKTDKTLMAAIQDSMFVFDNLGKSDDRSLQKLLREVETDQLVLALKGADEGLRDRLLSCISTRAAANVREEIEAMGPVRLTEVQEAQKRIVAQARAMADEGAIVLAGRGGDQMV